MKICTACQRYVKNNETTCPFCSSEGFQEELVSPTLNRGASRARVYAARAVIASAALSATAACGNDDNGDPATQTGGQANTGGNEATGGNTMATGGNEPGAGGTDSQGGEGGDVLIPIYGGPFPDMMKARV
jgi:hypothetical protein